MDRTEEMLVDLMGDLDVELLEDGCMESDLERGRMAWLTIFLKEKNWRKDDAKGSAQAAKMQAADAAKGKKRARRARIEKIPLSYEWGEAIRTDMGKRFHDGVRNMERRAAAAWGVVSGMATMAVVALGFFALMGKKRA